MPEIREHFNSSMYLILFARIALKVDKFTVFLLTLRRKCQSAKSMDEEAGKWRALSLVISG
jgi:hypothetical protein